MATHIVDYCRLFHLSGASKDVADHLEIEILYPENPNPRGPAQQKLLHPETGKQHASPGSLVPKHTNPQTPHQQLSYHQKPNADWGHPQQVPHPTCCDDLGLHCSFQVSRDRGLVKRVAIPVLSKQYKHKEPAGVLEGLDGLGFGVSGLWACHSILRNILSVLLG